MLVNDEQLSNKPSQMISIPLGILTDVKEVHPAKAHPLISVIVLGKTTDSNIVQSLNASSAIVSITCPFHLDGTTTLAKDPPYLITLLSVIFNPLVHLTN